MESADLSLNFDELLNPGEDLAQAESLAEASGDDILAATFEPRIEGNRIKNAKGTLTGAALLKPSTRGLVNELFAGGPSKDEFVIEEEVDTAAMDEALTRKKAYKKITFDEEPESAERPLGLPGSSKSIVMIGKKSDVPVTVTQSLIPGDKQWPTIAVLGPPPMYSETETRTPKSTDPADMDDDDDWATDSDGNEESLTMTSRVTEGKLEGDALEGDNVDGQDEPGLEDLEDGNSPIRAALGQIQNTLNNVRSAQREQTRMLTRVITLLEGRTAADKTLATMEASMVKLTSLLSRASLTCANPAIDGHQSSRWFASDVDEEMKEHLSAVNAENPKINSLRDAMKHKGRFTDLADQDLRPSYGQPSSMSITERISILLKSVVDPETKGKLSSRFRNRDDDFNLTAFCEQVEEVVASEASLGHTTR